MKNKERERKSKAREYAGKPAKVPLTYYRSADTTQSADSPFDRKVAHKGKFRLFFSKVFDSIAVLTLVLILLYSILIKSNATLSVTSTDYRPKNIYKNALDQKLSDLKNRNKITFNEAAIVDYLQKKFPEIEKVNVELPLLAQTPKFDLTISPAEFLFNSGGQTYVIDSQGTAVGKNSDFPNIEPLPTINDQSGFTVTIGKQVLSADAIQFIKTVLAQSKHANVPVASLNLPTQAQELDLKTSDKPYFVKFYLGGDALQQSGQFLATRHQLDATNTQPSQYLDVRVVGKVFYK